LALFIARAVLGGVESKWENNMLIKPHRSATTPPKVEATIQACDEPAWVLAKRHGTPKQMVWK
jgi:hypothetical protein